MKVSKGYEYLFGFFLLLFQFCLAQRGYNYVRPGISSASPSAAVGGLSSTSIANPLRPIAGNVASGLAAAPAAFGTRNNVNIIPNTAGFNSFQGNIASPASSNAIGSNYAAGVVSGIPNRSAVTGPSTGIFGTNAGRSPSTQFTGAGTVRTSSGAGGDVDYENDGDYSAIPGIAGVDYPIYSIVPQTSFNCAQQPLPGYYSDVEAQCQVFHICALNRTYSFLCPNGTVFSQETLVCVWWNQYDCVSAPSLYANNAFIYDYGNQGGVPRNAVGYQDAGTQIGIGSTRSQIAANAGRSSGTIQPTGIYGGTVGGVIRPAGAASGGFGGLSTSSPAALFTGGAVGNQISIGRRQQTAVLPNTVGQTYSDASMTTFGNIVPSGLDASGGAISGGFGAEKNALQTAQLSMSSANREYLPPARRS